MLLLTRQTSKLLQTVKVPNESADVDPASQNCRRRVDIITDLQFADLRAVIGLERVQPAGFVTEDEAAINQRRRSPDGTVRFVTPNTPAFVGGQTIQIAIPRSDVNSSIRDDRTRPHAAAILRRPTQRLVLPN